MNPLVPASYDIVWSIVFIVGLALTIAALVSIARRAKPLTATHALVWTLLAIFVPLLGPIAWLTIGRRASGAESFRAPADG